MMPAAQKEKVVPYRGRGGKRGGRGRGSGGETSRSDKENK